MSDQSTVIGERNLEDDEEEGSFVSSDQMKRQLKAVEDRLINPLIN